MATRTLSNAGGAWSTAATWVENAVPTAADDVVATATSGALSVSGARVCRSIDFSAYLNTMTMVTTASITIGDATAGANNKALHFGAGMTFVRASSTITFASTSGTQQSINFNNATLNLLTFNGAGSSYILGGDFSCVTLTITQGTFNDGGFQITVANTFASNNSNVRAITLSGTTILNFNGGQISWNTFGTTNLTFTHTGTIRLNDTASAGATQTLRAGNVTNGLVFNNVEIYTTGTNNVAIEGSNTFNNLTAVGGATETVTFQAGSTQTLVGGENCFLSGLTGNVITIKSSSNGSAWNLTKASGDLVCDYLSVQDSVAAGGATFYAGANSTDVSGNSGWLFEGPTTTTTTTTSTTTTTTTTTTSSPMAIAPLSLGVGVGLGI